MKQDYFIQGESDEDRRARWDREDQEEREEYARKFSITGSGSALIGTYMLLMFVAGCVFGTIFGAFLIVWLQVNGYAAVH
jgi:hypothetical protein